MAANSYTLREIYVIVKEGQVLPDSLKPEIIYDKDGKPTGMKGLRPLGEGANNGTTLNGQIWFKDCFIGKAGIEELRVLIHAEDAGVVEIKPAEEMSKLLNVAEAILPVQK